MGTVPAGTDSILGVGSVLWTSMPGVIQLYRGNPFSSPGLPLNYKFDPASRLRMAIGPDQNVWIIESNSAANGTDTLTRWTPRFERVGEVQRFANSAANPSAIVAGPDGAVWIVNRTDSVDNQICFTIELDSNTSASSDFDLG